MSYQWRDRVLNPRQRADRIYGLLALLLIIIAAMACLVLEGRSP